MVDDVLSFIQRRFYKDCNWTDGNCYYFALILKTRFPGGLIYYDVINGHFLYKYCDKYYDWTGIVNPVGKLVEWGKFGKYDAAQKKRITRSCLF